MRKEKAMGVLSVLFYHFTLITMPRFNTAADLLLDRGLNSLVCAQCTPIPVGGTEPPQENTLLKAYSDRTFLSTLSTKTKRQPDRMWGHSWYQASAKNIVLSLFALITQGHPRGARGPLTGTRGGGVGGGSEKNVRDICRFPQERQCICMCG